MSKIELTKEQVQRLRGSWSMPGTYHEALEKVANELVAMGLVRPASDDPMQREWEDVKARVAALEAKYETLATATLDPSDVDETPDPHAVAKERAKLWGVELVRVNQGEGGDLSFASKTQYWNMASWLPLGTTPVEEMYGFYKTTPEAWSNFPTEPPPGWEAKCEHANIVATTGDTHGQCVKCNRRVPKPRTDADRLGALADAAYVAYTHDSWESHRQAAIPNDWRRVALAVRKAVLTSQLEPSEEEIDKACNAYEPHYAASTPSFVESVRRGVTAALTAAARVRLEKAEGEKP